MEILEGYTKAALAEKDKKIARLHTNLKNKFLRALTKGDHTQVPDYTPPLDVVAAQARQAFKKEEKLLEQDEKIEPEFIYWQKLKQLADEHMPKADEAFLKHVAADAIIDKKYTDS
jgi:hypothetical protein